MVIEGFIVEARQACAANFDIFHWLPLITRASLTLTIIHKVRIRVFSSIRICNYVKTHFCKN
jgi:hypothetical protein